MIQYFQTTTLILGVVLFSSIVWTLLLYELCLTEGRLRPKSSSSPLQVFIPALVLSVLAVTLAYQIFGVNLIFPVHLNASFFDILSAACIPGMILGLASGLYFRLSDELVQEYARWCAKPFILFDLSLGKSSKKTLRRLVLLRALSQGWSACLPWLFSELVIVEALFNAQGLALDAWHMARTRDFAGFLSAIVWLMGLYFVLSLANWSINFWLGRRLESYV